MWSRRRTVMRRRWREDAPIVGVTGPDEGGAAAWYFTKLAVALAGGHAVRITPGRPRSVEGLDALILGGGADVDPKLYGVADAPVSIRKRPEEPALTFVLELILFPVTWVARKLSAIAARHSGVDVGRDELEMELLGEAVARGMPVLGICRGEQLINVYFGGTLHQDLAGFYVEDAAVRTTLPRKRVVVGAGTKLRKILGAGERRVNALHSQAIATLGRGLKVAARDRNGIVQAIEREGAGFVVGVQWHPEYLPQLAEQRGIFRALVRAGREWGEGRGVAAQRMRDSAARSVPARNEETPRVAVGTRVGKLPVAYDVVGRAP